MLQQLLWHLSPHQLLGSLYGSFGYMSMGVLSPCLYSTTTNLSSSSSSSSSSSLLLAEDERKKKTRATTANHLHRGEATIVRS